MKDTLLSLGIILLVDKILVVLEIFISKEAINLSRSKHTDYCGKNMVVMGNTIY